KDTHNASRKNPARFQVIGEIGAGSVFEGTIGSNQAVRIMTGAKIPEDCDAVIMLELVREKVGEKKTVFELKQTIMPGNNISFMGEDTKKDTVLVRKGAYIHPGVVALLATFGYKNVP